MYLFLLPTSHNTWPWRILIDRLVCPLVIRRNACQEGRVILVPGKPPVRRVAFIGSSGGFLRRARGFTQDQLLILTRGWAFSSLSSASYISNQGPYGQRNLRFGTAANCPPKTLGAQGSLSMIGTFRTRTPPPKKTSCQQPGCRLC
ncbi:hypothetical protein I7I51_06198 [Histoplasma capsulatum]|uniref:Uncharacterized protein n=1 Tax=Ajellomyces capsulatus TaxID=5037 RepID=A0A8A1MFS9_AJECA|nr:hypothetical protein I7I51_06198 [Histoplasma capsulatum]